MEEMWQKEEGGPCQSSCKTSEDEEGSPRPVFVHARRLSSHFLLLTSANCFVCAHLFGVMFV